MSLWIDVTSAASYPPPRVGISRVEWHLAKALCEADPKVRTCLYDARARAWSELPREEFLGMADAQRRARASGGRVELSIRRGDRSFAGGAGIFDRGDVLVCCGFHWRPEIGNMDLAYDLRRAIGLRVIAMCHDIVAIAFPHFVPGMETVFAPYMRGIARNGDHVLCNSRCTERDLLRWIDSLGDSPAPATSVMPLGCALEVDPDERPGDSVAWILRQRFVLSVSTIETRKNHQVLCRAYAHLVEQGIPELPPLVLVGAIGHDGASLIDEIAADARLSGRVSILCGVTDTELSALYDACLFTLYPSFYEGWGLPVSESLAHGKLCIASDRGSLPEAGGAFADYADPYDVDAWARRIRHYLTTPGALSARESEIRQRYVPREWRESAAHVLTIASRWTAV